VVVQSCAKRGRAGRLRGGVRAATTILLGLVRTLSWVLACSAERPRRSLDCRSKSSRWRTRERVRGPRAGFGRGPVDGESAGVKGRATVGLHPLLIQPGYRPGRSSDMGAADRRPRREDGNRRAGIRTRPGRGARCARRPSLGECFGARAYQRSIPPDECGSKIYVARALEGAASRSAVGGLRLAGKAVAAARVREDAHGSRSCHGTHLSQYLWRPNRGATRAVAFNSGAAVGALRRVDLPRRGAVLRRREGRAAPGLSARGGHGAVAAGRCRGCRPGALRPQVVAGHRHRRSACRRLLHAAGHDRRPDRGQHARGPGRGHAPGPSGGRPSRARTRARGAGARRLRRRRHADQRQLRGGVAAARRRHRARRGGRGLAHVVVVGPVRGPRRHPGHPDLGNSWLAADLAPRVPGGPRAADHPCRPGRGSIAARRPLRRLPRPHMGRLAPRAARRGDRPGGHLVADGVEHRAQRRSVRARIDHRQPAVQPAFSRHRRADVVDPRGGDRRAHPRRRRAADACGRAGRSASHRHAGGRRSGADRRLRARDRRGRAAARRPERERRSL
jgi:hypothetical protein